MLRHPEPVGEPGLEGLAVARIRRRIAGRLLDPDPVAVPEGVPPGGRGRRIAVRHHHHRLMWAARGHLTLKINKRKKVVKSGVSLKKVVKHLLWNTRNVALHWVGVGAVQVVLCAAGEGGCSPVAEGAGPSAVSWAAAGMASSGSTPPRTASPEGHAYSASSDCCMKADVAAASATPSSRADSARPRRQLPRLLLDTGGRGLDDLD